MMKQENLPQTHLIEMVQTALQNGQEITITANGWSMFPCLRPSDVVKIHPTPFSELKFGDIIAFQRKKQLIVHRYVSQNTSQGDSCLRTDEPITEANYIGKISAFQREKSPMKTIDRLDYWKKIICYFGKIARFTNWMLLRIRLKLR
jgi:hypothetical protein